MKLNYPKKDFLTYKEALVMFEDGEVPFEPFCVVEEKDYTQHGKKLIIGYRKDGGVMFIQDRTIEHITSKDEVEAYHVSRMGINTYYKKVARPKDSVVSIFRKPKVGDTVLCVANERYVGATFGETYEVKEITHEGRLAFEYDAQYTYESKYFVIVSEKKKFIVSIHDSSGTVCTFKTSDGTTHMAVDPYKDTFGIDIEEDELIVRKKLDDDDVIRPRKLFDATLIQRSK